MLHGDLANSDNTANQKSILESLKKNGKDRQIPDSQPVDKKTNFKHAICMQPKRDQKKLLLGWKILHRAKTIDLIKGVILHYLILSYR